MSDNQNPYIDHEVRFLSADWRETKIRAPLVSRLNNIAGSDWRGSCECRSFDGQAIADVGRLIAMDIIQATHMRTCMTGQEIGIPNAIQWQVWDTYGEAIFDGVLPLPYDESQEAGVRGLVSILDRAR